MSPLATRSLGDSGLDVSVVGLGANNFGRRVDLSDTRRVIDAALDTGITFVDSADIYGGHGGSETLLGEVLEGRRDRFVLATKFGMDMGDERGPRGSRDYVANAAEASLRRLRTDVIDFYWYHQPDGVTPIAETLGALHELVTAGKVRAIGASNFSADQLRKADAAARGDGLTRFAAVQNEYSLLVRDAEAEVLPACEQLGIAFVPFFPLASGLLTGKYHRGQSGPDGARLSGGGEIATDRQFDQVEALQGFADARQIPLLAVAIGALLAQPAVASVIAGATRPEQVQANAAAGGWTPSDADRAELESLLAA
ncbi:MAG: aldo/keto reductase [Actinomycetota bacterium]|nr:aldo/keto reductase [Actinomycetota bacterium]